MKTLTAIDGINGMTYIGREVLNASTDKFGGTAVLDDYVIAQTQKLICSENVNYEKRVKLTYLTNGLVNRRRVQIPRRLVQAVHRDIEIPDERDESTNS